MQFLRGLVVWICLLGSGLGVTAAAAQFATVQGRVVDRADGAPLQGVHVVLDDGAGTRLGTATDTEGTFSVANVPPGRYRLAVSFIGYLPYADTLTLAFGDRRVVDVALAVDEAEMGEVVVEAEQGTGGIQAAGFAQVRPAALARVPMPDVSADLAGYLLTLPGVVSTGDRGGQLFIRGGTPTQNLILLDGMRILQPFHIVGFYSIFPADLLAHADVYAGGFGARYGGRLSSVIDVTTRNGSKQRVGGAVSVAPFLSAVRLEVPVVPEKMSLVASVRESVIERIAPDLLGRELPYRFGDLFLKTHAYLSQTSSFSATALRSFDEGDIAGRRAGGAFSRWQNEAVGGRYTYLPAESPVLAQMAVYLSRYDSRYAPAYGPPRRAAAKIVHADINFAYLLGDTELHFGIFAGTSSFRYNLTGAAEDDEANVTEGGAFLEGRFDLGDHLRLEPGLRVQAFSNGVQAVAEPRLRGVWRPGGATSRQQFSAAWGRYHQQIFGLTNQRDVTDAFVAWAPVPPSVRVPAAEHLIAGWQRKLSPGLDLLVEGYRKTIRNLAFPRLDEQLASIGRVERVDGAARGVDLRLEVSRPWFYGYIGYGLATVTYERTEGPVRERFHPPHDRRHQLQLLGQVVRGPYRLSLRWQYGSGLPFTQVDGYYEQIPVGPPGDRAFHTRPGTLNIDYGAPYAARLPAYHRLDVSVERRFPFRYGEVVLQGGVINAYDRANIFTYDRLADERIDQLPLIPSVGLKIELH